ncbi:hypothetical protein BDV95DRAFT_563296 [Massariosphaeria phaeospora]|uniref:Uncharacterized protein n=1 Tax=Massariosphaeria phaeospora TaxID=100035 RepID=A0A7C8ICF5_9PLEO|nr:hypothetical protein BDV95DRAFT_563296 [Massariosphaeria phaeospora]
MLSTPLYIGLTPDYCLSCKQRVYDFHSGDPEAFATSPLYMMIGCCDNLVCQNCLTEALFWAREKRTRDAAAGIPLKVEEERMVCPWCRQSAGFEIPDGIRGVRIGEDVIASTQVRDLRRKAEVWENPIVVEHAEAVHLLQVLGHRLDGATDADCPCLLTSPGIGLHWHAPLLAILSYAFDVSRAPSAARTLITPAALQAKLLQTLDEELVSAVAPQSLMQLNPAIKHRAQQTDEMVEKQRVLYSEEIVGNLVALLAWRHMERLKCEDDDE